ncbi:hypothetical protein AAVH_27629 [Aphelenchoides avenae]|nr:hypothetical protein AAVH_27629 [Aphelenchus avenae]
MSTSPKEVDPGLSEVMLSILNGAPSASNPVKEETAAHIEQFIVSSMDMDDFQLDDDSASNDVDDSVQSDEPPSQPLPHDPKISLTDLLARKSKLAEELETLDAEKRRLDERRRAIQQREMDIVQEMASYSNLERTMLVTRMTESKSGKPRDTPSTSKIADVGTKEVATSTPSASTSAKRPRIPTYKAMENYTPSSSEPSSAKKPRPGGAMFKPRKGKSLISWDEISHHVDNLEAYWHKDKAVGTCPVCLLQVAAPGMTHFYRHLLTHLPKHCLPHKCPLDCGFMATQWEQCRSHIENKHKLPWNDGMKQLSVHEANRARWDALTKRS